MSFFTFGCKTNQYETNIMIESLKDTYEISIRDDRSDIYIVNSCSVTSKASKESRLLARRLKRKNPEALVIYTGCDAYVSGEKLISEGIHCLGNSYKHQIESVLNSPFSDIGEHTKTYSIDKTIRSFAFRSRALLKIQEGCNNHCTYCIIPFVRGRERDKDCKLIVEELEKLSNTFDEVVLTGTNMGAYRELKKLLTTISHSKSRIRLSSIEPMYVDKELIDIIAEGNFAMHLHVPLQSGSKRVLRLMGRNYSIEEYRDIVEYASEKGIFVGTDVIVGFYGEGEKEFHETYRFIENLPLAYGHIFSYSRRTHTPAPRIKLPLERGPIVKERHRQLIELFKRKFKQKLSGFIGKQTELVFEDKTIVKQGKQFRVGIASEYFKVLTEKTTPRVTITHFDGEYAYG